MSGHLNIVAVIASEDVFGEIEPLLSRTDLDVSHVRSGQHALALAQRLAYDLILSQHPLADVELKELLAGLHSSWYSGGTSWGGGPLGGPLGGRGRFC